MNSVAVLFARRDSIYKTLPGVDVWDADRDARGWPGGSPVVAHPPCRTWAMLSHFAKPRPNEEALAAWAVRQVQRWGGVLEHPARSRLWPVMLLPEPGIRDSFGGWTLPILQWWWGHKADKATRLYICGCEPRDVPPLPYRIGEPTHCVAPSPGNVFRKKCITHRDREATPPALAQWLVELARRCNPSTP